MCGGSAYFVRDPQTSGDPAQLMSWSPDDGLGVAFETEARGRAFLTEPRCGGTDLTLAALTQQGDAQVTASVRERTSQTRDVAISWPPTVMAP